MENLPFVVLQKLFKIIIDPVDLVNLSHVCKNWQAAYEAIPKPNLLFLHYDEFVPLHHRLFYTGETVVKSSFLKVARDLQFLRSEGARIHFMNIKKLVIFPDYKYHKIQNYQFSLVR